MNWLNPGFPGTPSAHFGAEETPATPSAGTIVGFTVLVGGLVVLVASSFTDDGEGALKEIERQKAMRDASFARGAYHSAQLRRLNAWQRSGR